jgi:hypothetical protein
MRPGLELAQPVISAHQVTWPNATPQSVREVLEDRLRISSNPVLIVVDAQRRIVAVDRSGWFEMRLRDHNSRRPFNDC